MKRFYNQQVWRNGGKHFLALLFVLAMLPSGAIASGVEDDSGAATPSANLQGKTITIKGNVTDASTGDPLIGAVISVKGTVSAVPTDVNGNYQIRTSEQNPVLEVKLMGYESKESPVGTLTTINFSLNPRSETIEDVVITTQGTTQRKASVVGAQASVQVGNLKTSSGKLSTQLAGQMSGIVSIQKSGEPGSGAEFYIRGISTLAGANTPLIMVDGVERSLDLVDTDDIESFSVLKDASASAVYGVRGANGVVLIQTKRGKDGKPVISAKYETGILTPDRMPKLANSHEFATLFNEVRGYSYYSDAIMEQYNMDPNDPRRDANLYPNVDWLSELFNKSANNQRANLSVSGGSKVARYYIGGSFYNEGSIFKQDQSNDYNSSVTYNKFSFRANLDVNIFPTTVISLDLANMFETKTGPADQGNVWGYGFVTSPNAFPKYYTDQNGDWLNWSGPVDGSGKSAYNALMNSGYYEDYTNNTQATVKLKHSFTNKLEGLSLQAQFAWDAKNYNQLKRAKTVDQFIATGRDEEGNLKFTRNVTGDNTLGYATARGSDDYQKTYVEAYINYDKAFGRESQHRIGAFVQYNHSIKNIVAAGDAMGSLPYKTQGLAARAQYGFMDRYFLELNVGYNGSENFSPGNRFGLFPSISVGWLVSEEKFMQKTKSVISMLKLRGSWGKVGNDQIGGGRRFIYNATVKSADVGGYDGFGANGGTFNPGARYTEGEAANANVGWEESEKLDIGIELELFKGSLKIQADYFSEYRNGIFWPKYTLSPITGIVNVPYVNVGQMSNKGFEASLEYYKQVGDVVLTARGTFTFNRNKVINDEQPWAYPYLETMGKPHGQPKLLIAEGLFRDQSDIDASAEQGFGVVRPGDIKYRDINNDGIINDNDKVAVGYGSMPEISFGAGGTVAWKGFEFQFLFQGTSNADFTIGQTARSMRPFEAGNLQQSAFNKDIIGNIWTVSNPNVNAKYPRAAEYAVTNNRQGSTFWRRNKAYVRLKNVEIAYSLPRAVLNKIRLNQIRFYLQGTNLLTFSDFKLWDPETGNAEGSSYPNNRIYSVGIQIQY